MHKKINLIIKTLIITIMMIFTIGGVKAADVTSGFKVENAKLCKVSNAVCTSTVYDANNGITAASGTFGVELNWSWASNTPIKNGDTVSIDYGNETNTVTTTNWQALSTSGIMYDTNNQKIGTFATTGSGSTQKLKLTFSDNAVGKTSLAGTITTQGSIYASVTYVDKVTTFTLHNQKLPIKVIAPTYSEMQDDPYIVFLSSSNTAITSAVTTPRKTTKELYNYENYPALTDDAIFDNVVCEVEILKDSPNKATFYSFGIYAPLHSPTNKTDHLANGNANYTLSVKSLFTEVEQNSGETYEQLKARLQPYQYAKHEDSEGNVRIVVNYGKQPSDRLTYKDALEANNKTAETVGEYLGLGNRWAYDDDFINIFNRAIGPNGVANNHIAEYTLNVRVTYEPQLVDTIKSFPGHCTYTDANGTAYDKTLTRTHTLKASGSIAVIQGTSQLYLFDEDTKNPIPGATIKLEKNDNGTWTSVGTKETDSDGKVSFPNLNDGEYRYSQTAYVAHYVNGSYKDYDSASFNREINTFNITDGNGNVVYATNKRQSHTVTYKPGAHGDFTDQSFTVLYGDPTPSFDATTSDANWVFKGWSPNPSSTVTGDATYTAQWRQVVKVTIKHVDANNNQLIPTTTDIVESGSTYTYNASEELLRNYTVNKQTQTGTAGTTPLTITFVYTLKPATLTVRHVDVDTGQIIESTTENVHYTDPYNKTAKTYDDYDIVSDSGNTSGTISQDNVIVTFSYRKKTGTVTVHHYIKGTTTKVADDETITDKFGKPYQTAYKTDLHDYKYKSSTGTTSGNISKLNDEVIYYYELKDSVLTVNYLEWETEKELANTYTHNYKYTDEYEAPEGNVPRNYQLKEIEGEPTGTVSSDRIYVTYYYVKKNSKINDSITKTGQEKIISSGDTVTYKIKYKAVLTDYIGDATVVITDTLPYEIDTELSNIDGGVYENKTITWTETIEADSSAEETIEIEKNITVVYKDIDLKNKTITNQVKGAIALDNNESEILTTKTVDLDIPGKVIVKYVDEEGKQLDKKEIKGQAGDSVSISAKEITGYTLKEKPEHEVFDLVEGDMEVVYKYEKIKYAITVKVTKGNGSVNGSELVEYGGNSTPGIITIKADNGSYIGKVTINGKSQKIGKEQTLMTLDAFKNVKEDKVIEVEFEYLAGLSKDVPKTGNVISIVWPLLLISTVGVSAFIVTAYSKKNKIKTEKK